MSALPQAHRSCGVCGDPVTVVVGGKYQPRFCSLQCAGAAKRVPLAVRFWRRVTPNGDACWPWMGARDSHGYGLLLVKDRGDVRRVKAHRLSYELEHGPIPDGFHVLHSCDNPPCVNPAHLRVGSHADNMRDKADRRRASSPGARLDEDAVRQVRRMVAEGASQREVSRVFGIDPSAISLIVNRKTWRHVGA